MSVQIIVLGQVKTLHNFHVELLDFKSFFPSAIIGWNSLDLDVRNSVSLPTFKAKLRSTLFPHSYNKLFDFSSSRRASVDHTRLRHGFSCLRTFALIVYAHPYCARNSCRNAMLRHTRARVQKKKSIHMKGWYPLR